MLCTRLFFREDLVEKQMISQISTPQILHPQVQEIPILEYGLHVNDERVLDFQEEVLLIDD